MKIGIVGLPQSGKKLFFRLLTGSHLAENRGHEEGQSGVADIRDSRFSRLVEMYSPKKEAPARIEVQLVPGMENNSVKEGAIFRDIADADALCLVIRAFKNDSVYHIDGSINPLRDADKIISELIMHDLIFIEKRFERLEKNVKKKEDKNPAAEKALLEKFRERLEGDRLLADIEISEEEKKIIASYPFITLKKIIIAVNTGDGAGNISSADELKNKYGALGLNIASIPVKLESEIASLESAEERAEFMKDAGIEESALNMISRLAMEALGLISFFTVGKDEVRQWQVKEGSSAPRAASAVHSDIERGFIRAEVIKYGDLIALGSEDGVKKAGKLHVMGKDYIVEDGDIINFRFNV